MTKHFVLITAGHLSHGKSALVKALTGTDPDRLPEEKKRGMTTDLGFAHLGLTPAEMSADTLDLGIIDVPGHENFVKNMMAGAGSIDLVLLVVAADEGWMPQTEEHLQILSYLGVSRGVVVLSKNDLSGSKECAGPEQIREKLLVSPFAEAPIVPISTLTGEGLEELKATLARVLGAAPALHDLGKPRVPIDQAFVLPGIGTIIAGTLRGGCLQRGQEVVLQPSGRPTHIRSLQSYHRDLEVVGPGTRIAMSLADGRLSASRRNWPAELTVRRGHVVTVPDLGGTHTIYEVLLERSLRLAGRYGAARPLRDGTRARFHIGSADVPGRLFLAGRSELDTGDHCVAQIRLESPVFAFQGDRFVVRDWAERVTLAGGGVLEPGPSRSSLHSRSQSGMVNDEVPALTDLRAVVQAHLRRYRFVRRDSLLVQSNFSRAEIAAGLEALNQEGRICLLEGWVVESSLWNTLRQRVRALVDAHHRLHPDQVGIDVIQLRSALGAALHAPELFESVLADLLRDGYRKAGPLIKRASHRPVLPPHLQTASARIRGILAANPLEPPSRRELASDTISQQALQFLLQTGDIIEIGDDLVLPSDHFCRVLGTIRQRLHERGPATVNELRQVVGSSYRVVVPLVEMLDRAGITRREGDKRVLKT